MRVSTATTADAPTVDSHPANQAFFAKHGRVPVITHLSDTDLYKFTMQQAVLHQFPSAEGEYLFKCRNQGVDLRSLAADIELELEHLAQLQFTNQELDYLGGLRFVKPDYVEFLRLFKLRREFVTIDVSGDQLSITIKGPMLHVMPFEIYLLAIVNELYFRQFDQQALMEEGHKRLLEKVALIEAHFREDAASAKGAYKLSDFGTRRRFSREWQGQVVHTLKEMLPDYFVGTSNVFRAMTTGLPAIGTMAHEYLQAHQALGYRLVDSQKAALEGWVKEYRGDLGIALTDVIGMEPFCRDFDLYFAKLYDGVRHDSGDPKVWGDRMIRHYEDLRIDPMTKTLVFSDGLTTGKTLELFEHFKGRANTAFGVGTHFTNDMGVTPLNIVIKLVRLNGQPTAKLSDSKGKTMCDDETFVAYLKQVFQVQI